jgi:hypothetical protein
MPKMFYMPYAHVLLCAFYLSRSMIICIYFDYFNQKERARRALVVALNLLHA